MADQITIFFVIFLVTLISLYALIAFVFYFRRRSVHNTFFKMYDTLQEDNKIDLLKDFPKDMIKLDSLGDSKTLIDLQLFDGFEFENFVADLLSKKGYKVFLDKRTGDKGRDIITEDREGNSVVIECKHWYKRTVGRPVVQKLHSATITYSSEAEGAIYSSGYFSKQAIEYAKDVGILLVDLDGISVIASDQNIKVDNDDQSHYSYDPYLVNFPTLHELGDNMFNLYVKNLISYPNNLEKYLKVSFQKRSLELDPYYLIYYDLEALWMTSTKSLVIYEINKSREPLLFDDQVNQFLKDREVNILFSNMNKNSLKRRKIPPSKNIKIIEFDNDHSFEMLKTKSINEIIKKESRLVSYYGRNNVKYQKKCIPKKKDIFVESIRRIYLPKRLINLKIADQKASFEYVGQEKQIQAPIEINSNVDFSDTPFICNECNKLFQNKIEICYACQKVLCSECANTKKILLLTNNVFCSDHTKKMKNKPE